MNTIYYFNYLQVPENYPLEKAGPVLCAGITMFSPLNTHQANTGGKRVGIVGIGGLGQLGLQMAKAMGIGQHRGCYLHQPEEEAGSAGDGGR